MVSMNHVRALIAMAPGPHFCSDVEGQCTGSNDSLLEITGMTADEALGWGWASAIHPDDRDATMEAWKAQVERGVAFRAEFRLVNVKTGAVQWTRAQASALRDDDGTIIGYCGQLSLIHI